MSAVLMWRMREISFCVPKEAFAVVVNACGHKRGHRKRRKVEGMLGISGGEPLTRLTWDSSARENRKHWQARIVELSSRPTTLPGDEERW